MMNFKDTCRPAMALLIVNLVATSSLPSQLSNPFFHGSRHIKKVALTFDACSPRRKSGYDKQIVDILIRTKTPATFFLGGYWILQHPAATRRLASNENFEIGNHTLSHKHMTRLTADGMTYELNGVERALEKIVGRGSHLFRPPFGEYDSLLVHTAGALGLSTVMYDLPSGDPDTTFTRDRLTKYVVSAARNGSIIVMHVNGRGWHTAESLEGIIEGLRKRGFELVRVSDLMNEPN